MVPFCFGDRRRHQPAHVQDILEKAADGIRTHDLLHGKQTGSSLFSRSRAKTRNLRRPVIGLG
jgi:hypothetical protein